MSDFHEKQYPDRPGYKHGSPTSYKAARDMDEHAPGKRLRVLAEIERSGVHGATCDEIVVSSGMLTQTVTARLRELVLKNQIIRNGVERPTRSGKAASVYVIAPTETGQLFSGADK